MEQQTLTSIGLILISAGIALIVITLLVFSLFHMKKEKAKMKGGGAIIIGPVPIVFGTDKETVKTVLKLSIILMVAAIIFTVALRLMK